MSIIQTVRDKYLWVVSVAIALSVIGFLLMDSRSGSKSRNNTADEVIASVNGKSITYGAFMEMEKMIEENYMAQGRPMDESTRQQIYQQVWSQLSDGTLLDQEIEKLGFVLTDKEINDQMFVSNPPEFLKQEFTNRETGQFDAIAARNALNQLKKSKNEVQKEKLEKMFIDPYIEGLLRKKYFTLLQASTYVPKWMAEKQLADDNAITSFQYVNVPYTSISDSTIKITDEQIDTYVRKHKNEYQQEEPSRSIAYVTFDIKATASDSAAALKTITDIKTAFQETKDPGVFATRNSSDIQYFDGYSPISRLMMPYKDSILAAGIGKVYGPYLDNNSWVLSRIVDIKNLPDSVKARHILIATMDLQTQQPKLDDASAKAKIDSIYSAIKAGADFTMMALRFSDDEGSKTKGGDLGYFSQGMMVPEFNDSCFQGKTGDMKIVRTQFGYHLINIQDQKGIQPSYKIAYMAKNISPSQETINDAMNKANMFAGNSRNLKAFDENLKKANYNRFVVLDIKSTDFVIPGIGDARSLIRWVYENESGEVSDPQDMKDKYVVAAITGVQDKGLINATKARPIVEPILRNVEKAKQIKAKIGTVSTLETVASVQKQTIQRVDSISFSSPSIRGVGPEPKIIGAAFDKSNLNKVLQPIEGNSGVFIIKPEMIAAKVATVLDLDGQRKQIEGQLKQSVIYTALNGLRKAANITDKRSKYL